MAWNVDNINVNLNLGLLTVGGTWRPSEEERVAAWQLYVELVTRVAVVPLRPGEGLVREALSSLYALFGLTRAILRSGGPALARPREDGELNFGQLAVAVLNYELRPLLAYWHPLLEGWEEQRPADLSRADHEDAWDHAGQLRQEVEQTRTRLVEYADLLAAAAGVPPLSYDPTPG